MSEQSLDPASVVACPMPLAAPAEVLPFAGTGSPPRWHRCPPDPNCPFCGGGTAREDGPNWSFLDAVYCISLASRPDRAQSAAAQFHRVGLCRQVIFYRPDRHPVKGVIGSWESHRTVAIDALARGARHALIFEDDVAFRRLSARTVAAIGRAFARLPEDWLLFYLGHWPLAAWPIGLRLLRTRSGCAHAYIASARLLHWLAEHPWERPVAKHPLVGRGVDAAFACLPGAYAFFPMVATQLAFSSDNFTTEQKRRKKNKWRLRHLVTHSRHREWLLANLMRPAEFLVLLCSPFFYVRERARQLFTARGWLRSNSPSLGPEP